MKVIIAGSRHMDDFDLLSYTVDNSPFEIDEVVSGCARGADTLGERWADERGIPVTRFPAEWDKYGKAAGPIRNGQMKDYADAAIIFIWNGSRGSENMLQQMQRAGKPVYVIRDGLIPKE